MESQENKKKQTLLERLKRKYRLIVYSDADYQPVFQLKYSRLIFIFAWTIAITFFVGLIYSVVAYTPVRELIPGYPTTSMKKNLVFNARLVDSLEMELQLRDQYFSTIKSIITGKDPVNIEKLSDSLRKSDDIELTSFMTDSMLFKSTEVNESNTYSITDDKKINSNISGLHYFAPIKGIVTNKFNSFENHYGTDIVASSNEVVKAVLPGTVTLAAWTLETGNVIQIQHDNNLISVYKHNAELLKKVGNHIEAGEPIAIVGNSGELTTGPHLHFELWHNGTPINPEDFVNF